MAFIPKTLNAEAALKTLETEKEQKSFQALTRSLRCVVCQNQSLAESQAPLAEDLRTLIHKHLQEGKTEKEILQFMVERYGTFVLYQPPVNARTLLLWIMPGVLLLLGFWSLYHFFVRDSKIPNPKP
ncbi:MAG: cytochrome c-type biogenesis protein CcmH [Gammaproteobacteria bacterium]|nr:cytochrome c-type biogenesis protein CcmH [Gammaproteobacteria bacterium]